MEFKTKQTSPTTKGILYSISLSLAEEQTDIRKLSKQMFGSQTTKLPRDEFQYLIKYLDNYLPYNDIDFMWAELDPRRSGYVQLQLLDSLLKVRDQRDDLFQSSLDLRSSNIRESMKTMPVLSEEDKITLGLKDCKDSFAKTHPYMWMDEFDTKRSGTLNISQFQEMIAALEVDQFSRPYIIKGIFGDESDFCTFADIMRKMGLENVRKKVDFESPSQEDMFKKKQGPNSKPSFLIGSDSLFKSTSFNKKKAYQKPPRPQGEREEVVINNIPPALAPYYTGLTEMTEPFLSLALSKIQSSKLFCDNENPASEYSNWRHVKKHFKQDYFLFEMSKEQIERSTLRTGFGEMINANSVNQGQLGDCYFMSAVAAVAEFHPELIHKLFVLDKNPSSIYGIRLFVDGKWETVALDATFPIHPLSENFAYAKPNNTEIWSMLLEKAWAKLYKSYNNIASGTSSEGLTAVSGASCIVLREDQRKQFIVKIKDYLKQRYVISVCGNKYLKKKSEDWQKEKGLYASHAYSVINLHSDLDWKDGKKVSLIKLRNPWGSNQWKGNWAFKSSSWTPQLRNKLNYHKNPEDGSFYMEVKDFQVCFDQITVCQIIPKNVHSCVTVTSDRHQFSMVEFDITTKNKYFISVIQESKRKYKNSSNYQLSKCRFFLAKKLNNGRIEAINSQSAASQDLNFDLILEPGTYQISCKVEWRHRQSGSFNVSLYGPQKTTIKQINNDHSFLQKFITDIARKELKTEKKEYYFQKEDEKCFRIIKINQKGGYGYILLKNQGKKYLNANISIMNADNDNQIPMGIDPFEPDSLDYVFSVGPGEEVIKCLLVDPALNCSLSISQSNIYLSPNKK